MEDKRTQLVLQHLTRSLNVQKLDCEMELFDVKQHKAALEKYSDELAAVYTALGGQAEWQSLVDFSVPYLFFYKENKALFFDVPLQFNRYRKRCLQSSFYESADFLNVNAYLSYCNQFEKDCLKDGIKEGYWTNKLAKAHFGESNEPPFLDGAGAAAWKLRSFQDLLIDIGMSAAFKTGYQRVAIYDKLLVNGELLKIGDLLYSTDKHIFIAKLVSRKLNIKFEIPKS